MAWFPWGSQPASTDMTSPERGAYENKLGYQNSQSRSFNSRGAEGSMSSEIRKGLPIDYRLSVIHSMPYMIYFPVGLEIAVFPRGCPTEYLFFYWLFGLILR